MSAIQSVQHFQTQSRTASYATSVERAPAQPHDLSDARWRRFSVLLVPGWHGSGEQHWQTRWQQLNPTLVRVEQSDWTHPDPGSWVLALDEAIKAAPRPVILVAHSLGCITVAHWAKETGGRGVAAALLVAPADVERSLAAPVLQGFSPIPVEQLPFSSRVVATDNDPACSSDRANELASAWGADLVVIPSGGHLNAESQLGDWTMGQLLLHDLVWRRRAH